MNKINTRKSLNPAYRKHKPLRKDVNLFTDELLKCLQTIKLSEEQDEHEEHYKEPIKTFFKNTFYKKNYINTKDRIDLAIYTDKDANSDAAVIIEVKRPSNKAEFLTTENLNRKALQELLLYYLRERIDNDNNNIKHLIATNGYQWFLFKSEDFYKYFFKNKELIKEYEAFRDGNKDSSKNELFYNEIATKYIKKVENELPFVQLDFTKKSIKEYSDADLNTLYKIFSDVHFLGNSFGNDSNQLNKSFYNELLHIIGLEEIKNKGKKIIERKVEKNRNYASFLENTIFIIEERDYLNKIKSVESGKNKAFDAGLELTLTWINRILFLKLLESQLLSYHNGNNEYRFLNTEFIKGYDDLNDLFFSALAKKHNKRHTRFKDKYKNIPYLNSSLFEKSTIEDEAFAISALNDDELPIYAQTVLKDTKGNRIKGNLKTLDYLFQFLDAYDFATDGTEGIEDSSDSKTLINASVLGLIFEKINGYKEGSFYTPAYITMYMSKETLRRAVVQKFKEQENKQINTFEDLQAYTKKFFKKDDLKRFNKIINSLKIVDPAVGSGHFLVSALNELISIKNDLGILVDTNGLPLQSEILIENDELYITDKLGHLLDYKPENKETANIQKTLFHEKQILIENCLFGVDINPNSVKICRLRLWIELLKNAYYTDDNQLHTLPNIDINIKTGNSLISRFNLQDELKNAFKGKDVKYTFGDYKNAVAEYKNTNDKSRKYEILEIIEAVKKNFKTKLRQNDSFYIKLNKLKSKFFDLFSGNLVMEPAAPYGKNNPEKERELKRKKMEKEIKLLENKVKEIKNSNIYHNAFEWRFEFPEVLDNKGNYVGFDVVIGNPPYLRPRNLDKHLISYYKNYNVFENQFDLYHLFIERGYYISSNSKRLSFIVPNTFLANENNKNLRKFIINNLNINKIIDSRQKIFEDADVDVLIFIFGEKLNEYYELKNNRINYKHIFDINSFKNNLNLNFTITLNEISQNIFNKILSNSISVQEIFEVSSGIKEYQKGKGKPKQTQSDKDIRVFNSTEMIDDSYKKELRGKNIDRYLVKWNNEFIKYGEWLAEPRNPKFFKGEKILIRKIPSLKYLILSYTDDYFIIDQSIYIGLPINSNFNILYSLACLNSRITHWYFVNLFNEFDDLFPQIKTKEFKSLLIPKLSKEAQQPFIEKVNQILALKKADPKADTSQLENEIDQMVYALYELTDEEIGIIENSMK